MKSVSVLMALAGSILCAVCFVMLIMNVSTDCDSMTNLLCSVGFVFFSWMAADGWYKLVKGKTAKQ